MGDGFQFIDIILLAMVAGFIALRLRSVLGRRSEDESRPAADPLSQTSGGRAEYERAGSAEAVQPSETVVRMESDPKLRKGFQEISRADPSFDVDEFLDGAKAVYPMILDAFWNADRETLRGFLSDDVYAEFENAIAAREEANHQVEGRVVDITDLQIEEAGMNGRMAEIAVRYNAEIVSVTRDSEGNVVEGDVSDTTTVSDLWTFQRDADSEDPNWILIATRSG